MFTIIAMLVMCSIVSIVEGAHGTMNMASHSARTGNFGHYGSGNNHGGSYSVGVPIYQSKTVGIGAAIGKSGVWKGSSGVSSGLGVSFKF
jgi:hypothetical protein